MLNTGFSVVSLVASKAFSRFFSDNVLMLSLFSLTVLPAFWARSRLGGFEFCRAAQGVQILLTYTVFSA